MIKLLVFERDSEKVEKLREILTKISFKLKDDLDIYWLYGDSAPSELLKRINNTNLAIISMLASKALETAIEAHKLNSLCRLLIYDGKTEELPKWIKAGPVAFCNINSSDISEELERLIEEIRSDINIFSFVSRREQGYIPYKDIIYFSSDLRYVDIFTTANVKYRMITKLDDLEQRVTNAVFIRIHQSFLVNLQHIHSIDFASHDVILSEGSRLPCSNKYYKQVCAVLKEKKILI